jgi:hypothetical protein
MPKTLDILQARITALTKYCDNYPLSAEAENLLARATDLHNHCTEVYDELFAESINSAANDETEEEAAFREESLNQSFDDRFANQIQALLTDIYNLHNPIPSAPLDIDDAPPPGFNISQKTEVMKVLSTIPFNALGKLINKLSAEDHVTYQPILEEHMHAAENLRDNVASCTHQGHEYLQQANLLSSEVNGLINLINESFPAANLDLQPPPSNPNYGY